MVMKTIAWNLNCLKISDMVLHVPRVNMIYIYNRNTNFTSFMKKPVVAFKIIKHIIMQRPYQLNAYFREVLHIYVQVCLLQT